MYQWRYKAERNTLSMYALTSAKSLRVFNDWNADLLWNLIYGSAYLQLRWDPQFTSLFTVLSDRALCAPSVSGSLVLLPLLLDGLYAPELRLSREWVQKCATLIYGSLYEYVILAVSYCSRLNLECSCLYSPALQSSVRKLWKILSYKCIHRLLCSEQWFLIFWRLAFLRFLEHVPFIKKF